MVRVHTSAAENMVFRFTVTTWLSVDDRSFRPIFVIWALLQFNVSGDKGTEI
jgi:hypothetical protein